MNKAAYSAVGDSTLAELSELCSTYGITHGSLHEGAKHFNNHGITDDARVFIKIGRRGSNQTDGFGIELAVSTLARANDIAAPRSLAPLLFLEDGRAVTIWSYEATTARATRNISTARRTSEVRSRLKAVALDTMELPSMRGRLRSIANGLHERLDVNHQEAFRIRAISTDLLAKLEEYSDFPQAHIQHGDMHPRNVAWRADGDLMVFDWESALLAPPEWEYAEVVRDGAVWGPKAVGHFTEAFKASKNFDQPLADDLTWIRLASSFALMVRVMGSGGAWARTDISYRAHLLGVKDLAGLLKAVSTA